MGAAAATAVVNDTAPEKVKGSQKKLILIVAPVLLAAILAGLWFSGILPGLLGMRHAPAKAEAKEAAATPQAPVFVEIPEMISNLDASARRATFVKLKARFELAKPADQAAFAAAQPRIVDLLLTYLHETHPEELQEHIGTDRLREALLARTNIIAAPAQVLDLQFSELLVQ